MDICENCHEKDRNVIKCEKKIEKHLNLTIYTVSVLKNHNYPVGKMLDTCEICGKIVTDLYFCNEYDKPRS